jgi:ferredoxin
MSGAGKVRSGSPEEACSMAWKVVVDFDVCESNAICMAVAPEVFEVRDDDFLYVLQDAPPDDLRPKVEQAVRQCPKQAIKIEDE